MEENGQGGRGKREVQKMRLINLKIEVSYCIINHVYSIYKSLLTFMSQTIPKLSKFPIADRTFRSIWMVLC